MVVSSLLSRQHLHRAFMKMNSRFCASAPIPRVSLVALPSWPRVLNQRWAGRLEFTAYSGAVPAVATLDGKTRQRAFFYIIYWKSISSPASPLTHSQDSQHPRGAFIRYLHYVRLCHCNSLGTHGAYCIRRIRPPSVPALRSCRRHHATSSSRSTSPPAQLKFIEAVRSGTYQDGPLDPITLPLERPFNRVDYGDYKAEVAYPFKY